MTVPQHSRLIAAAVAVTCAALLLSLAGDIRNTRDGAPSIATPAASTATSTVSPTSSLSATPDATSASPSASTPSASLSSTAPATRATAAKPTTVAAASANLGSYTSPPPIAGWRADWSDTFDVPIESTRWGRYGYGLQVPGQGAMGRYLQPNTFTSGGKLILRTQYANGEWSSAGVSSGDFYAVSGGRWEVRAKFPVSKGIGYVFLLWPADESWPPEIDFAEGRVNGPQVMGTYHYDSDNKQSQVLLSNSSMSSWHTYGVIIGATTITYTLDGKPWAVTTNPRVTTKPLWVGFQCGAMDPNGSAKQYETVDNGVPGPLTPAISDIQIDWVAHYVPA